MTRTAIYARRLSGTERYSLSINTLHPYNVVGIVDGRGDLDEHTLQRAVAIAADANPGIRVRLRAALGFSRWEDSGVAPEVGVIDAPDWDGRSEIGAPFLQRHFDALAGDAVSDVLLIRGRGERRWLCFRSLHAAIDGRGAAHWEMEVFRVLRGETPLGSRSTVTDIDVARRYRSKLRSADAATRVQPPAAGYIASMPVSPRDDAPLRYIWRALRIPRRLNNILPQAAAFLGRYARSQNDGAVALTIPVDFRGLRTDAAGIGNLTGYLRIPVETDATPRAIMHRISQQLRAHADCAVPLQAAPLRWIGIRFMARRLHRDHRRLLYEPNTQLPTAGLVSLGQGELDDFCCPGFTADTLVAIPGAVGKLNIVIINLPHETIATFSTPERYNHDGQLDRLVAQFAEVFSA